MLEQEAALPPEQRMQCLSIVTPNDAHADIACAALEAGFHVICDKPMAGTLEAALDIESAVRASGLVFALTHTYMAYPMVIEARERIRAGELGSLRRVAVSYLQDWLSRAEDTQASVQARWRNDPERSGEAVALADIGTHALNLVEVMTGQRVSAVAAQLRSVLPGRLLDDDGMAMFELTGGAAGQLTSSQVCSGAVNALQIEIFGEQASLYWHQESPNQLVIRRRDAPQEVLTAGANQAYLSAAARAACRTPGGHPEGYIEAFANQYAAFAADVCAFPELPEGVRPYATTEDGLSAMRFVRAVRLSNARSSAWTRLDDLVAEPAQ